MEYTVYTARLTNADANMVNEQGRWSGRFAHYANVTFDPTDEAILGAVAHGFYEKTRIVFSDNKEAIFAQLNGMEVGVRVIDLGSKYAKSLSVGDVLVGSDGQGWVVAMFGFKKLGKPLNGLFKALAADVEGAA